MPITSCIRRVSGQKYITIRKEYVSICDGDHCAATMLSVFEFNHNGLLLGLDKVNKRAAEELGFMPDLGLGVYKTIGDLMEDAIEHYTEKTIRAGVDILIKKGFVTVTDNTWSKFSKTKIYELVPEKVNAALLDYEFPNRDGKITAGGEENYRLYLISKNLKQEHILSKSLGADAPLTEPIDNKNLDLGQEVSLKPDELSDLEYQTGGSWPPTSAPSVNQTTSGDWTPLDEKIFWSKYKGLSKAKRPDAKIRTTVIYKLKSKKVSPEDALMAIDGFSVAGPRDRDLKEFLDHFESYLDEGRRTVTQETALDVARALQERLPGQKGYTNNEINNMEAKELFKLIAEHRTRLNSS